MNLSVLADRVWNLDRCPAYREPELLQVAELIAAAKLKVAEDSKQQRDGGSAVIGAGICVNFVPKHHKVARRLVVIPAPFQGDGPSERASMRALAFLLEQGVRAYWWHGRLD